jgi:hypothetical protein
MTIILPRGATQQGLGIGEYYRTEDWIIEFPNWNVYEFRVKFLHFPDTQK